LTGRLFLRPDVGQQVLGFNAIKGALAVYGPLGNQPLSSQIYGLYTAFVYLMPLFGGIIADRWLGRRKSVVVGAVLMAIGPS
jgi:proton-dependent oligopeptide transporter, POT family